MFIGGFNCNANVQFNNLVDPKFYIQDQFEPRLMCDGV